MVMKQATVIDLVRDVLYPSYLAQKAEVDRVEKWYRHDHEDVDMPRRATPEHRKLAELAKTPFLGLVVTNVAQALYTDGYRSPNDPDADGDAAPWNLWEINGLGGRQGAIYRAALAHGASYGIGLPGEIAGARTAVLRGASMRSMVALYADLAEDDWPMYALRVQPTSKAGLFTLRVLDDEAVYRLTVESGEVLYLDDSRHEVGVCPVVRYSNLLDLDGRSDGEVVPFIPLAKRIDKTVYDRLLTQHFNSWKVRTIAGMSEPENATEAAAKALLLRQNDILVAEDADTKFGTLPETALDGFIRAYESDIKTLAAATQTPVHALVGDLVNISADGLAAANASLSAKVDERKSSFGQSHGQLLRLGASIVGDVASAQDYKAHVVWRDTSIRTLNGAADALGKFATMLGVPVEALWGMIPGVTKTDVEEWRQLAASGDSMSALLQSLTASNTPPPAT